MKHLILVLLGITLMGCSDFNSDNKVPKVMTTDAVQTCASCHGVDGRNGKLGVPPLSGRSYEELVVAMVRVRSAYSPQPLLGHDLTDDDIKRIATYYSNID